MGELGLVYMYGLCTMLYYYSNKSAVSRSVQMVQY
jgi:hypothetical protein